MGYGRVESAELSEYRLAVRRWLSANIPPVQQSDHDPDDDPSPERIVELRRMQGLLHAHGFAGFTFPVQYGGQGLTPDHERVYMEEARNYNVPNHFFGVSINILGATLAAFGTADQKARHLPRILSGQERWLQLLSEPSGGSDLAGLLTSARRDGETYIVSGQKIWSTGAHLSDYAMCPVRTRWDVPKHKGISLLIVDLKSPGIDIRRISQINGESEFCEEFLNDVAVPASNLIGEENEGWRVIRGLLEIEHAWVGRGGATYRNARGSLTDLATLLTENGRADDWGLRRKVVGLHVGTEAQRLLSARVSRGIETGKLVPGYGSLLKLGDDTIIQRRTETAMVLAGDRGVVWETNGTGSPRWADDFLTGRRVSIAGGTDEILRNNVSERVLGLPREPSLDRDTPFNLVPHN